LSGRAIRIEGEGIGACVFARLSKQRGDDLAWQRNGVKGERYVAIDVATIALLSEIFGREVAALVPARRVQRRRLKWESARPAEIDAPVLVCDVNALASRLAEDIGCGAVAAADWLVTAAGRAAAHSPVRAGGRRAMLANMAPPEEFDLDCAEIAATPWGWLFAAARADGRVAVTFVCPGSDIADEALGAAIDFCWPGHVREVEAGALAAAAPQFSLECAWTGRLLVGDAALALDPLRGDGVGFALRGAILAHAVTNRTTDAQERSLWLAHYRERLRAAFASHVRHCVSHYERAAHNRIWRDEIAEMRGVLRWPPPRLEFALHAV
jgi:hypothetical protein